MIRRILCTLIVVASLLWSGGTFATEAQSSNPSQIQVVHLAPSSGSIDVYVDETLAIKSLNYKDISDSVNVSKSDLTLGVVATGGILADAKNLNVILDPPNAPSYVIALVGSASDGTFSAVVYVGTLSKVQIGSASSGTISISGAYARATALKATPEKTAEAMGGMDMTSTATAEVIGGMDMSGPASAAYMTIANSSDKADKLVKISTDIADASIHQTVVIDNIAQMQPLPDGLDIPANSKVELRPGSYHIMLMGLKRDLIDGDTIQLTLTFQSGTKVTLTVPIKQS